MSVHEAGNRLGDDDRIHVEHEYELCAWARYFNASERSVKEAVAAVGDRAVVVKEHLASSGAAKPSRSRERPSA